MFKIIGADRKEYGPVSAGQIRQWIQENRLNQQTMVCREGSTDWVALGTVSEFAPDFAASRPHPKTPTVTPSLAPQLSMSPDELLAGARIRAQHGIGIMDCLSRGWRLVMNNLGLLVGVSALIFVIQLGVNGIWLVGWLASMVIQGPLMGGLYAFYLRRMRNQEAKLADAFSGFGPSFVQLMVTQVVIDLLAALSGVLFVVGCLIIIVGAKNIIAFSLGGMICVIGLVPPIYLYVSWMFALPLVIDKKLDFSEAMTVSRQVVHDHWWSMFGLLILGSLVACLGVLALGVGIFFTMPVFLVALLYAYEDFFGSTTHPS